MMLNVFLCEDNYEQREKYLKFIKNTIVIENLDMNVVLSTADPYEVINYISENDSCGLYFLDIDLKSSINGINLAVEIRKYDPRAFIVFITTHSEMGFLTFRYRVETMDFIIKDDYSEIEERIRKCIIDANTRYCTKVNDVQKNFTMKVNDKVISVEYSKILFFETSHIVHKIILHAIDRQIEFYGQMKEVEERLDDRFYRCHKSYLVNKDNVDKIDIKKKIVYMINGEECLTSSRLIKSLT